MWSRENETVRICSNRFGRETDRVAGNIREYQCDNPQCDHPRSDRAIVAQVNEQEDLNQSVSTKKAAATLIAATTTWCRQRVTHQVHLKFSSSKTH